MRLTSLSYVIALSVVVSCSPATQQSQTPPVPKAPVEAAQPKEAVTNAPEFVEGSAKTVAEAPAEEPIQPLEMPKDLNPAKVALGEKLYNDTRLSMDNTLSCASCHALDKGGTDLAKVSTGIGGVQGPINSPTVFNSGLNFVQFWDGRAKDLEEQAAGPVHNPKEMGSNWDEVIAKLNADAPFVEEFKKVYPDGISGKNIVNAIAEFEKTLVTVDSPFDKYLRGDKTAISQEAIDGYAIFKDKGCTTCHNGPNVGGNSFQKLGVMKDYFADRGGEITEADLGRFNVTKDELDKHFFRVASLRVAALTPPYFHDGSREKLEDAIRAMGRYQLGVELTDSEVLKLVAFLKSLVGTYKGKPLLAE